MLPGMAASAQNFVDPTSSQMRIDTLLPKISHFIALPKGYQDSLYSVKLLYPEYTPLTRKQRRAYRKVTGKKTAPATPEIRLETYQERKNGTLGMEFMPVVTHNDRLCFISSFLPQLVSAPAAPALTRAATMESMQVYADNSVLREGSWAKIRVSTTGIHRLTADVIRQAGFSDLSKVKIYGYGGAIIPEKLTQDYLRKHDDLKEIATCTVGDSKYFYAQGPVSWDSNTATKRNRNFYSDYGYYFITEASDTPLACSEADLLQQATSSADAHHYLYENDKYAWAETGRNLFDGTEIRAGQPMTVNVLIPAGNTTANIQVVVSAGTTTPYTINHGNGASVNGTVEVGKDEYNKANVNAKYFTATDLASYPKDDNGATVYPVTISTANSSAVLRLDYVSANFATPATPVSLSSAAYPAAQYYCNITNQNHHADTPTDIVIIIPTSQKLREQAERLAECHRQHDGMTTRIVPADELYNEYSSGTPDMTAYRRYLKMFYDKAESENDIPKHVILFGDALWDNRIKTLSPSMYSPDDYLLTYETENSYYTVKSTAVDDYITVLQDNMTVHTDANEGASRNLRFDIAVGRIPVVQSSDAKAVVDKIIHYMTASPAGPWQNEIMFMGDDGDNNSHMANINSTADKIINSAKGYNVKKVMLDAYEKKSTVSGDIYPEATAAVKKQQNDGALIMNYGGHASWVLLSHEKLLVLSDFANFKGSNYSLWFTAGCETVPFDGTSNTLGETALLNEAGGAIAFIGTARTVFENDNAAINDAFMSHILEYDKTNPIPTAISIGEAMRLAKNDLVKYEKDLTINKHHFTIIGDPALRLALPKDSVVIDYINETPANETSTLKGNSTVNVRGHIASRSGNNDIVSDFNGTANILVRDSKQTMVCRGNDKKSDTIFSYDDRLSTLYKGTCDVRNGQFAFTFKVPRDIYDDGEPGLITVYAMDPTRRTAANGECSSFTAQGWEDINNDLVGPSIYAYLNNPSFSNNDAVGQTPFFVAEISDKDGINTTSSSIGHNMELIIDKEAAMTYDLNENFQFDSNSYTTGQTYYVLPPLAPGSHSLSFRAWDLLGNSNTVSLDFRVVKGMQPELYDVSVAPNPITDTATFYVTHDRQGSAATICIDIIDPSGRTVDILQWDDVFSATSPTTTYRWTPSGIARGLYLYRVRVSCDGSDFVSQTKKLIIAK